MDRKEMAVGLFKVRFCAGSLDAVHAGTLTKTLPQQITLEVYPHLSWTAPRPSCVMKWRAGKSVTRMGGSGQLGVWLHPSELRTLFSLVDKDNGRHLPALGLRARYAMRGSDMARCARWRRRRG